MITINCESCSARHPCVSITTFEESHALSIVAKSPWTRAERAIVVRHDRLARRVIDNALRSSRTPITRPRMQTLAMDRTIKQGLIVMLDLCASERRVHATHVSRSGRCAERRGRYDHPDRSMGRISAAVRSVVAKLDLSYPDEKELESIIKSWRCAR